MAQTVKERFLSQGETIDFIIPVPLSEKRLKERGFNQSLLLAERIAGTLKIPLEPDVLIKFRDTAIQHDLDYEQRIQNLRGAFRVADNMDLTGKRILIVDDVATTCTTLSECGKALYLAGAERVLCCTAAIAVH